MTAALVPPLRVPLVRLLLVVFVVLHVALALGSTGPTPAVLAALVLLCAAAGGAVLPSRLPAPATAGVVAAPLLGAGLVLAGLPLAGWPGYAAWPLGAATFVALALTVRDRIGAAWLLLAGLALESVAWSLLHDAGPLPGLDLVVRHAGTLLLGTLFAVGLRRAARSVQVYREAERAQQAQRAVAAAAGVEQRRTAKRFLALAGPALEDLAEGGPTPSTLRALEGRLRDEVTAPGLLTERLNEALAAARTRGADVVLLEEPAVRTLPSDLRERAATWLAKQVAQGAPTRVVARVTLPAPAILRVSAVTDDDARALELPVG